MTMVKKLSKLLDDAHLLPRHPPLIDIDVNITNITSSSQECSDGSLFVAMVGATANSHDGHDFIDEAIDNGACAVVIDKQSQKNISSAVPVIVANNSRRALSTLSEAFFDFPSQHLHVIGITGTNGKTSTTFMLHNILKTAGFNPKIMGTLGIGDPGNLIKVSHTTMDPVFISSQLAQMKRARVSHVIMEVSSHALALHRVDAIKFSAVALTNITQDHLDFHETITNYQAAKARLFFDLADKSTKKILPIDHPFGSRIHQLTHVDFFSSESDDARIAEFFAADFHLKNASLASALARQYDIGEEHIRDGLLHCLPIPGRLEQIHHSQPFLVFVDYAHTPHALSEVLSALKQRQHNKIIVVFGCAGDRDRLKRPLMGKIASELADIAIVTDDNPRSEDPASIRQEVLAGAVDDAQMHNIGNRKQAIAFAIKIAQKNDVVVIAGKGHETYQIYQNEIHEFCDQEIAREILTTL